MTPTRSALRRVKPTLDTPFHIDYSWWERKGHDLRVYLISHLLPEQREFFSAHSTDEKVDWIDPETAEVKRVDALQQALHVASRSPSYITPSTPLVDAVFRVFLANGNKPLTPVELGRRIGRPPEVILKVLSGSRIYNGIRPVLEED